MQEKRTNNTAQDNNNSASTRAKKRETLATSEERTETKNSQQASKKRTEIKNPQQASKKRTESKKTQRASEKNPKKNPESNSEKNRNSYTDRISKITEETQQKYIEAEQAKKKKNKKGADKKTSKKTSKTTAKKKGFHPFAKHKKLKITGIVVFVLLASIAGFLVFSLMDLPKYDAVGLYTKSGYSTVLANDGKTELARITTQNRIEVPLDEISDYAKKAVIATEDERFYSHIGIDPWGVIRAFFSNLFGHGGTQGASTITQQLVRNTVMLDEMNVMSAKRKVREMYIAIRIEQLFSKDEILEMYLNAINFGDNCYGIEAASQNYFGIHAKDLSLAQAAMLIGIPQSPNANNPRNNYSNALNRGHVVLKRMLETGSISQEEYDSAMQEEPAISKDRLVITHSNGELAPYFVSYVKTLMQSEKYNVSELLEGGLTIYTALDPDIQQKANETVTKDMKNEGDLQCSLVTIDPDNGNILAMVGGTDYQKNEYNLATQMSRQAGSSFKPFALLASIVDGVDPDKTYVESSSPVTIDLQENRDKYKKSYQEEHKNDTYKQKQEAESSQEKYTGAEGQKYEDFYWTAKNSEGKGYGNMSISSATTSSVNTVYARFTHVIGPQKVVDIAKACGITSELQAVDSICLGSQGVNTLEMANAYATIANGGTFHEACAIKEIKDIYGDTVYTHDTSKTKRVLDEAVAVKCREILQTVIQKGTGTSARLNSAQECAGKTGTSDESRDLWFCGFTPNYSTAIWCGKLSNAIVGGTGGTQCAPIWKDFMTSVLQGQELTYFVKSDKTPVYQDTYDFSSVGTVGSSYKTSKYNSSSYSKSYSYDDDDDYSSSKNSGDDEEY